MSLSFVVDRVRAALRRRAKMLIDEPLIDPRKFQPPLPLPTGYTKQQIHDALAAISVDRSARGELQGYASADCERFLYTLGLMPEDASGTLLEIGANPYFTTLLFRRFRPKIELTLVNFFGAGHVHGRQAVTFPGFDGVEESIEFEYQNINIEDASLPFADDTFDYMLFCEVLEHMTHDPLRAVLELKRVLKPDGVIILTTPNAARLENVATFLEGRNMYDPFSAYGPYGRHNREYTRHELHLLMTHCGFEAEASFTGNVHADLRLESVSAAALNTAIGQIRHREHDLGQYLFTRWRNARLANEKLPAWLYRSYPPERMATD